MGHFHILKDVDCGNAIPVRKKGILPCNFLINPLKNNRILKKKLLKKNMRE